MLTYASDFWPVFWTIIGGGALLTVLACLAVATFSPSWLPSRRGHGPMPAELATVHQSSAGYGHEAAGHSEAA